MSECCSFRTAFFPAMLHLDSGGCKSGFMVHLLYRMAPASLSPGLALSVCPSPSFCCAAPPKPPAPIYQGLVTPRLGFDEYVTHSRLRACFCTLSLTLLAWRLGTYDMRPERIQRPDTSQVFQRCWLKKWSLFP